MIVLTGVLVNFWKREFVEKKTLFTLVHGFETAMSVFNSYF